MALIATDGFLQPLSELTSRGMLDRKGFPESYDTRALLRFVSQIKSGVSPVSAPVYSHLLYDRVPGELQTIENPDIVIIEGLNVLAPPTTASALAVSDLFDFGIYVDARTSDIATWYEERFLALQQGAFSDPRSYFHRYAQMEQQEAREEARRIWREINEPNLVDNILPTRPRASLILAQRSGSPHSQSAVATNLGHCELAGDHSGQIPSYPRCCVRISGLHHDANKWLGARGAQEHSSVLA